LVLLVGATFSLRAGLSIGIAVPVLTLFVAAAACRWVNRIGST
jgi:hypothetical protein